MAENAIRMIELLEAYDRRFAVLAASGMAPEAYGAMRSALEDVRAAKHPIYTHIAREWSAFIVAHATHMTALWEVEMARLRGSRPNLLRSLSALADEHDTAVELLRRACESLVRAGKPGSRKPPAAPSAGF